MGFAPQRQKMQNPMCVETWGTLKEEHTLQNGDVEATYICDSDVHHSVKVFKGLAQKEKLSLDGNDNAYKPTSLEEF